MKITRKRVVGVSLFLVLLLVGLWARRNWPECFQSIPSRGGEVSMDYIGRPQFRRIDQSLKDNRPIIAKVYINGVIPHWVLIVGKEHTEYLMRDPLGDGQSLGRVSEYGSTIYAIRTLKRTESRRNR